MIEKSIFEASFPPIIPKVSVQQMDKKSLLIIKVPSGMSKPYHHKSEGTEKGTYIRLGRNTMRATPEMINDLKWQSQGIHFERLPVYQATLDNLDKKSINDFLKNRINQQNSANDELSDEISQETRLAYNLSISEHAQEYPTTAGMLLFGNEVQKHFPEAMIICTHFHGTKGRNVIATIDCEGTLFHQFRMAYNFVLSRLTRAFVIEGPQRSETLEVPIDAIREAILNAIVHRHYYLKSPTKIAIWDNRIEIFSPGAFFGPIDVHNLRAGRSYIRNLSICKIFREAGYIEKLSSGFIVMLDAYETAKLPPPQILDMGDFIKCVLPRPTPTTQRVTDDLSRKIISRLTAQSPMSFKELMIILNIPRSTLNRALTKLIDEGVLERTGKTRSVLYQLK